MSLLRSLFRSCSLTSPKPQARRPRLHALQAGRGLREEGLEERYLLTTSLVADLNPGPGSSNPVLVGRDGDHIYFRTATDFFRTDGVTTEFVASIERGIADNNEFLIVNHNLYYTFRFSLMIRRINQVDLTTGITTAIAGTTGSTSSFRGLTAFGDRLAYELSLVGMRHIRIYDGSQTTNVYSGSGQFGQAGSFTVVGDTLFFTGGNPQVGTELYKSDGTPGGTGIVKDINPGSASSLPSSLANVGGQLYFSATDGVNGRELWTSDGTLQGTSMVADIRSGSLGSDPQNIIAGEGTYALFSADDGIHGRELWVTPWVFGGGPHLIKDIVPGPGSSNPMNLTDVSGYTFFSADNGTHGRELWFSDWLEEGTFMLKDINPGSGSSNPEKLTSLYGYFVYFTADVPSSGRELYVSDWTPEGTVLDTDLNPGPASSLPDYLIELNGYIYFAATEPTVGRELFRAAPWASPGSAPGDGGAWTALTAAASATRVAPPMAALAEQRREVAPDAPPQTMRDAGISWSLVARKDRIAALFAQEFVVLDLPLW